MGLFGFFREKDDGNVRRRNIAGERELPEKKPFEKPAGAQPMQIRRPRSFADVEEIIDRLKDKLTVIVYMNELSAPTALRVTDILSGAIYALGGGMAELEKDIYIFTPDGVNAR
ncbi:MAG TPA: cell division protein SepF [Candidatus Borkfalkia avistercoris]|uniref:Cell division protein SepF n=1 Tax=Candidatus Borkfalkia avistercoris TaxID=2838504 RepID=A0A9D2ICJ1_9FIRM|nr:cell division protein SepF [Candidatus Borkfalkia avistercoris]